MINYTVNLGTSIAGIQHDDRHMENTDMLAMTVTIIHTLFKKIDHLLSQKFTSTKSNAFITIISTYFSIMLLNFSRHLLFQILMNLSESCSSQPFGKGKTDVLPTLKKRSLTLGILNDSPNTIDLMSCLAKVRTMSF